MYNNFYLAEKSSAANDLASFLSRRSGKAMTKHSHYIVVGDDVVGIMSGHLYELFMPQDYSEAYKSWRAADLPIIPDAFKLKPRADRNGSTSPTEAKIRALQSIMRKCRVIVGFGDPDAEGQLLQDEFIEMAGFDPDQAMRLWTPSLDDATLETALDSVKSNREYLGFRLSALCRSHADWLHGINLSRACTIAFRDAGGGLTFSVGRVQSPTAFLIVDREEKIRTFKPIQYHTPYIELETSPGFVAKWVPRTGIEDRPNDIRVDEDGRLTSLATCKSITSKCVGRALVHTVEHTPVVERAPIPFSLDALQILLSRKYGIGAKRGLEIAQTLYQKKLTTYPRVDTGYLPEKMHSLAPSVLSAVRSANLAPDLSSAISNANPALKSRAWNDKKVTAHFGIIPTSHPGLADEFKRLSDDERQAYLEIAKRYVLQFHPDAKASKTTIILACPEGDDVEFFKKTGKVYEFDGWRSAFDVDEDSESTGGGSDADAGILPSVQRGDLLSIKATDFHSEETTAPKRFTDGTLIAAMKSADKYVTDPELAKRLRESTGIGTSATRAPIIEEIIGRKFVERNGKELHPTEAGILAINLLPPYLKSPELTAKWQLFMDEVLAGRKNYTDFIDYQVSTIRKMVTAVPGFFKDVQIPQSLKRATPQQEETSFTCFGNIGKTGCGAPLKRIKWGDRFFFACSSQECKKTFNDKDGTPVESKPKTVDPNAQTCPKCNKGKLIKRHKNGDQSHPFWSCNNWMSSRSPKENCGTIYQDVDGAPDLTPPPPGADKEHKCPKCKKGTLKLRHKSNGQGSFWGCNNWRKDRPDSENCKAIYDDDGGKPLKRKAAKV